MTKTEEREEQREVGRKRKTMRVREEREERQTIADVSVSLSRKVKKTDLSPTFKAPS